MELLTPARHLLFRDVMAKFESNNQSKNLPEIKLGRLLSHTISSKNKAFAEFTGQGKRRTSQKLPVACHLPTLGITEKIHDLMFKKPAHKPKSSLSFFPHKKPEAVYSKLAADLVHATNKGLKRKNIIHFSKSLKLNFSVFNTVSEFLIGQFLHFAKLLNLPKDHCIFNEGDPPNYWYVNND